MSVLWDKPIVPYLANGKIIILIAYVDDIIVIENYIKEMDCLKKVLSREFKIKDIGTLRYFIGMEVARFEKSVVVSQRKYILVLLKENGILGCKLANTLMESNYKIGLKEYSPSIDTRRYH